MDIEQAYTSETAPETIESLQELLRALGMEDIAEDLTEEGMEEAGTTAHDLMRLMAALFNEGGTAESISTATGVPLDTTTAVCDSMAKRRAAKR